MEETPIKSHRFFIHFHPTELRQSFAWVDPTPSSQNFQEFSDRPLPIPIDRANSRFAQIELLDSIARQM
jgi:hypothetical protein